VIDLTVYLLVATVVAHLSLGLLVFFNKPGAAINRLILSLSLNVSLWTLTVLMVTISSSYNDVVFWIRASHAVGILFPCHVYILTHFFTKHSSYPYRLIIPLVFLGITLSGLSLSPYLVLGINEPFSLKEPIFSPLYIPYLAFFTGMILYSAILLYRRLKEAKGIMLIQLKILIVGILIPLLLSTLFNAVLPLLSITHLNTIDLRSLSPVFSLILVSSFTYVIVRYRFMDIRFAFRKYLSVVITAILIAGFFVLMARILFKWNTFVDYFTAEVIIATSVFIVVICLPLLRDGIQVLVEKVFFTNVRDYHNLLPKKARNLENILELDVFLQSLVIDITQQMDLELGFFCRRNFEGDFLTSTINIDRLDKKYESKKIVSLSLIIDYIKKYNEILLRSDLQRRNDSEDYILLDHEMESTEIELALPLITEKQLEGIIFLGAKKSGEPFYQEDIKLLSSLTSQVASTLINARLYEEILAIKEYQENILLNMGNGLVAINEDKIITVFNNEAEYIFGIPADKVIGQKITPALGEDFYNLFRRTIEKQAGISQAEIKLTVGKKTRYLTCNTSIVESPESRTREVIMVLSNVTRIKELEEEKSKSQRLVSLGEVAAGIAHEIKNPLVSIKTFADLLPEKYEDHDFRNMFSNVVSQEIIRINDLVGELLNFVKEPVLTLENVSIKDLIGEIIALLSPQLDSRGIIVNLDFQEETALIDVDRALIKQALLNICVNAVHAMPEGGILRAGITTSAGYLIVVIEDSGVGISDAVKDKIFDPFVTSKPDGVGIGLSISHKIVVAHGGRIVFSSSEGAGSRFEVMLPLS
jgi:PAS domain S-box-containing protein